jgi:hypothetical protein
MALGKSCDLPVVAEPVTLERQEHERCLIAFGFVPAVPAPEHEESD